MGQPPVPAVSVVLPTYRRPAALARTLAALRAQRAAPDFELLVIDNDGAADPGPALPPDLPGRVLREPRPGAAAARNRGVAEARADLVAFLDDDVVPDPDWLATLVAPLLAGQADLTGGRVLLDPSVPRPAWLDPALEGYLTALDLGPAARPLAEGESLLTASLAARTALVRHVGGFPAGLGPRGARQLVGDDVHLVRALRAAGARAVWVPGSVVVHELPPGRLRPGWVMRRAYWQGRSDWRVGRAELAARRAAGARVAAGWAAAELRRRATEGWHLRVAFHAACDIARTVGAVVEGASWSRPRPPTTEPPA